ncbi:MULTISPECIES: ABC transporter transmembrane domain-containing protein [Aerococcus]|uniref:Peptide cleavage/export ABC transporter n=1 Tax=Aerococcus sanguinicola TaxID=119206 RepID=A0A5N1GLB4_9LACT|nr:MULTISPECIES: ABC transporter transmembrane domain-containing protein [Aerococcus]KAA9301194.1 hypothetical protein F6I03_04815 [Aerococcus sanguinicola]MDK6369276.1 ABC transporter transmembrane domain-containing protein [Aerococcus sp. UMB9870]MDK6679100.1 ABC transporter transmembrane domain-containing protein [Aerococcus sp. UMB8608]MDK6687007.1 ABC transporter transmembrane domain-containing protein [Aerococcus sp. UMB8623]MDK6941171.1 ABC transporter transmembrane domain-containing pr
MSQFKWIKQHEQKDCGIACLAMILKHYGSRLSFFRLRHMSGSQRDGTTAYGLKCCLENLGFDCLAVEAIDEVWTDSEIVYPAIAHVMLENSVLHYVVVYGVEDGQLLIADPASGKRKESIETFGRIWTRILLLPEPNSSYQKVYEEPSSLHRFLPLLKQRWTIILAITLYSALITLLSILASFYFQVLIDDLIPRDNYGLLMIVSLSLLAVFVANVAFTWLRQNLLIRFGQNLSSDLLLDYLDHVFKLPLKFFETRQVGDIMSRFLDANRIIDALASLSLTLILDILTVFCISVVLFIFHPTLFALTFLTLPFYAWVIYKYYLKFDQAKEEEMAAASKLNAEIIQSLTGIETIKALVNEENAIANVRESFKNYMNKSVKAQRLENDQDVLKDLINFVNQVVSLWLGSYLVLEGKISLGQLVSFHALVIYFTEPLKNIINLQVKV